MRRRAFCLVLLAAAFAHASAFDPVTPGRALAFPRDGGSHPGHRIEWWYATGHLDSARGPLGFQVTFFRLRNPLAEGDPGRFAPAQLLFAHAALAEPAHGKLRHGERAARAGQRLAEAREGDTGVFIEDWSLARTDGAYSARVATDEFAFELAMRPTQAALAQGEGGFSRKGPSSAHASYYYSEPQLAVTGRVTIGREAIEVRGTAWLDHEWSSELLAPDAVGWDWLGANLDDGSALMAFRIRAADGQALWAAATLRPARGPAQRFGPGEVRFAALRTWRSPRTGVAFPVAMELGVGASSWRIEPLMDDQELDARASTGTLYWEGAVRLSGPAGRGGRGYLELTGYGDRLRF